MIDRDGYPPGVPCWIDVVQPDLDATMAFYGDCSAGRSRSGRPGRAERYAYARLEWLIVAGSAGRRAGGRPLAGRATSGSTRPTTPSPR